ncbi:MAG: PIN domain-containing protein [Desulfobacterales bacterium]
MKDKVFIDTNILIYAHDMDAGLKHDVAQSILEKLWEDETGIISTQVIQEFYVNVTRKIPKPITPVQARDIILNYFSWQMEAIEPYTILSASEIEEKYVLSFWDSLIIATASQSEAKKILTEDLNHGQVIEGVLVENPFLQQIPASQKL